MAVEGQTIEMPKFDPENPDKFFVKFKNHFKKLKAPFVIFKRLRATELLF